MILKILTGERGFGWFACRESVNDNGCFPVGICCCLTCAAFIRLFKSVAGNTLWGRWERGVDCDNWWVGMTGDTGLFLLSGTDGGVPKVSIDATLRTGDNFSCVSQSNLVDKNNIQIIIIYMCVCVRARTHTQAAHTSHYKRFKYRLFQNYVRVSFLNIYVT